VGKNSYKNIKFGAGNIRSLGNLEGKSEIFSTRISSVKNVQQSVGKITTFGHNLYNQRRRAHR